MRLNQCLSEYNHLDKDDKDSQIHLAMLIFVTSVRCRQLARVYNDNLDRGECREMLGNDLDKMSKTTSWLEKCTRLKHDMFAMSTSTMKEHGYDCTIMGFKPETTADFYYAIKENQMALAELLSEANLKLSNAPLSLYGNFYRHLRKQYNEEQALNDFKNRLSHLGIITADKLKSLRALFIAEFINRDTLNYAFEPSECERSKVDIETFKSELPHTFEFKERFDDSLVIFYRTVSQEGNILVPNYDCAGLFIFQHWDELTQTDIHAIFYLDKMLELIHEELIQLQPVQTDDETAELNGLPSPLATPEAMILWQKAIDAGWVDEHYQPLLSRTQAALLADAIAERLGIRDKWKVFEAFWNRKNMRNDYNDALNQRQTGEFLDTLKERIF